MSEHREVWVSCVREYPRPPFEGTRDAATKYVRADIAGVDWQPIETAPKDGTPVLLYGAELVHPVVRPWTARQGTWNGVRPEHVTHWMPVPEPPK